ncbi:MAG: tycC 1 [Bacteroidota bacterium]|jgi:amino acid adenylation domain-containing protein|nr:tycC 1 [Bacteroidota bacterium]
MSINNSAINPIDLKAPLVSGFIRNVSLFPQNNALWVDGKYYTYAELWDHVILVYEKIPKDKIYERIGIYCNDDLQTYASILAVNLYGAAYVPLNNKYPVLKNKKIVTLSECLLILCSVDNADVQEIASQCKLVLTLEEGEVHNQQPITCDYKKAKQTEAYILFTSGSTGEPKGVAITNENVNHCFDYFLRNYDFNSNDRFLQASELTFDFSVFSFFMPLTLGACCYVLPGDNKIKFMKIVQMLKDHHITILSMVPSILRYIENYMNEIHLPYLRYCFLSGDALYHDLAVNWSECMPNGQIHNCYGTTETTIVCTDHLFDKNSAEPPNGIVPLGKPFGHLDMIVVDEDGAAVEKGELAISGPQVIENYLGMGNDKKFFSYNGKKYYKPGDVVSGNSNDGFYFIGRSDSQVKVNGFRIELGEVEHVINKITGKQCIVLCSKDTNNINQLNAYVESEEIDENVLRDDLRKELPPHMIPKDFVAVRKFALSMNGKIDKSKLLN